MTMIPEDPQHIDDGLLGRYLEGACTPEEEQQVQAWIGASDANRAEFDQFQALWELAPNAAPKPEVDVDAAWNKMRSRMGSASNDAATDETPVVPINTAAEAPASNSRRWMLRIAAVLVLGLGVFAAWRALSGPSTQTLTASAELVTATLPDGTMVTLNANSSLSYPEAWGSQREVTLTGEAYFEVTPNPDQPFVIHTGDADVKVLGTAFNVRALPDQPTVEVAVESGTVAMFDSEAEATSGVTLEEGHKGVFSRAEGTAVKEESFEPTEVLQSVYGIELVFTDDALKRCKLTSTFKGEPAEVVMEVINEIFGGVEIDQEGNRYVLSGDSCK